MLPTVFVRGVRFAPRTPGVDAIGESGTGWSIGDVGSIARSYLTGAAEFVARLGLSPGDRVLDIACGAGPLSIPAARTGAQVTGIDVNAFLLEQACAAAAVEGLEIEFDKGSFETLPYEDGRFDTVISMFGAMFATHPARVAAELLRVTRPGGRIAVANWTPSGFMGKMLTTLDSFAPPAPGTARPLDWGDETTLRAHLAGAASLSVTRRRIAFEFPFGPETVAEVFRRDDGPTRRAFNALDAGGRTSLRLALVDLWSSHNMVTDRSTRVESEYLDVRAER